jgi:hypothetical protein
MAKRAAQPRGWDMWRGTTPTFLPDRIIYLFIQSRRALSFEMYHVLGSEVGVR